MPYSRLLKANTCSLPPSLFLSSSSSFPNAQNPFFASSVLKAGFKTRCGVELEPLDQSCLEPFVSYDLSKFDCDRNGSCSNDACGNEFRVVASFQLPQGRKTWSASLVKRTSGKLCVVRSKNSVSAEIDSWSFPSRTWVGNVSPKRIQNEGIWRWKTGCNRHISPPRTHPDLPSPGAMWNPASQPSLASDAVRFQANVPRRSLNTHLLPYVSRSARSSPELGRPSF